MPDDETGSVATATHNSRVQPSIIMNAVIELSIVNAVIELSIVNAVIELSIVNAVIELSIVNAVIELSIMQWMNKWDDINTMDHQSENGSDVFLLLRLLPERWQGAWEPAPSPPAWADRIQTSFPGPASSSCSSEYSSGKQQIAI